MSPTTHAVLIILMVLFTGIACAFWRSEPTRSRIVEAAVAGLGCVLVMPSLFIHMCTAGWPWRQVFVTALCSVALLLVVKDRIVAWAGVVAALSALYLVGTDYVDLVHKDHVTGNPADPLPDVLRRRALESAAKSLAVQAENEDRVYQEGWLEELPGIKTSKGEFRAPRFEYGTFWHSFITGLYPTRQIEGALWFPGGTLKDGISGISWRDRN